MLPHNCGRCNDMVVSANEAGEHHLANTIDIRGGSFEQEGPIHLRNPSNITKTRIFVLFENCTEGAIVLFENCTEGASG